MTGGCLVILAGAHHPCDLEDDLLILEVSNGGRRNARLGVLGDREMPIGA
jgi:hypothetical protein